MVTNMMHLLGVLLVSVNPVHQSNVHNTVNMDTDMILLAVRLVSVLIVQ